MYLQLCRKSFVGTRLELLFLARCQSTQAPSFNSQYLPQLYHTSPKRHQQLRTCSVISFHHLFSPLVDRTICVIGFLDSIVATKQMAMRFGYPVSPNRELVALGAGNLLASLFPGCLPAAGSITRSVHPYRLP